MPVAIDSVDGGGEIVRQWVAGIDTHHQIRSEVRAPRSRVIEVVFCVERVIPDQTCEDSGLQRQAFADRGQVRHVGETDMTQDIGPVKIWRRRRESENLIIVSGVEEYFGAPTRSF